MTYQCVSLIHYHEIGLKGHNRAAFEKKLEKNIRLSVTDPVVQAYSRISGRICMFYTEQASLTEVYETSDRVSKIPGVARVSSGYRCDRDIDEINEVATQVLSEVGEFDTFKVSARRNHTDFHLDSMQLNQLVGAHLCTAFPDKTVRMKNPDATVHVEVVQGFVYVYARSISGIGGLPVGSSGRVMCLLSSGIDSPVALWRLAKRGAICLAVHFSGRPQTASTSEYLVHDIAQVLEKSGCISKVYTVPFGNYQREIAAKVPSELRIIMYRRLMMKVAAALAHKEHAKALVTGESLGQVASQTLDNIICTDESVDMPIFRPLIGTDKQEIIAEAQRIGTFEISSQKADDCCTLFMPKNPETHANLEYVLKVEELLPIEEWLESIVGEAEVKTYGAH